MKRIALLVAFAVQISFSQNITIHHTYYTTVFSESLKVPVVVKWWLTKTMVSCNAHLKRTNKFTADPELKAYTSLARDYTKSGYDRGHNMPAEDNACSATGMKECFYYSNTCPQTPRLNRGAWKSLETYCRKLAEQYDSVLVWCGSVCKSARTIGPDKVAVPDYCWKLVYVKKTGKTFAYSFRNDSSESMPISAYEVSVDSVEHLSRLKFNANGLN